ncbi:hypothetical protein KAX22_00645 [bacterium]|nr:hypothetical protein [bacterium]
MPKRSKHKPKSKSRSRFQRVLALIWKTIIGFSVIIGIIAIFLGWKSNVSITPSLATHSSNPLSAPFIVKNEGFFEIYDIEMAYYIRYLTGTAREGISKPLKIQNRLFLYEGVYIQTLRAGEQTTEFLRLDYFIPKLNIEAKRNIERIERIDEADIDFIISYKWSFLFNLHLDWKPFQNKQRFRFQGARDQRGYIRWIPVAASEKFGTQTQ